MQRDRNAKVVSGAAIPCGSEAGESTRSRSPAREGTNAEPDNFGLSNTGQVATQVARFDAGDISAQVHAMVQEAFAKEAGPLTAKVSEATNASCQNICMQACGAATAAISQRLGSVESKVEDLTQGQTRLETAFAELSKTVTTAMARLSHSNSTPELGTPEANAQAHAFVGPVTSVATDVTTPAFFRKPDPTILYANTHGRVQVSRDVFTKAFLELASEANVEQQAFEITGDALDNRFDIQFTGSPTAAAAAALQLYQSLQLGRGKWKPQNVKDAAGISHQFYIQPDKNGAQVRREVLAKELSRLVSPLVPNKEVFVRKSTGSILIDRRVLASIFVTTQDSARIEWYHPQRIALGIEQAPIDQQFRLLIGGPSDS